MHISLIIFIPSFFKPSLYYIQKYICIIYKPLLSTTHSPAFLLSENPPKKQKNTGKSNFSNTRCLKPQNPPVVKDRCPVWTDRLTNQGTPRALKRHGPRRGRGTRPRQIFGEFFDETKLGGFPTGGPGGLDSGSCG